MFNGIKILAIVIARGGSKGLPKKNIKLLAGKPLIAYTIEAAKKSKYLDRLIISTDDFEIAEISKQYGAEVPFMRPEELARDDSPSYLALQHAINYMENKAFFNFDVVVTLQPTSPFRTTEMIDEGIEKFFCLNVDSVVSFRKVGPIPWLFKLGNSKVKQMVNLEGINDNRQNLQNAYKIAGSLYVTKKNFIKNNNSTTSLDNCGYLLVNEKEGLDIDTPEDFEMAEYLMNNLNSYKGDGGPKHIEEQNKMMIGIENKIIGEDQPVFIIAEAGVNHNGSLEIAKKLVDAAAYSGADAIKFQTFKTEELVIHGVKQADYQTKNIGKEESHFEMLKRLELPLEFHYELKKYAEDKGLIFMSTPFDYKSMDFLDDLEIKVFKAGSSETDNLPYLRRMARKGKPMIVSTGMSTLSDSKKALEAIYSEGNKKVVMLHCTTNYPCPLGEVNLNAMQTMKKELSCLVGYSDHTEGILVPVVAASMGAVVIEKHLTLDRTMEGPDHKASIEPAELREMVRQIRAIEKIKGSYEKSLTASEKSIFEVARKSVVSLRYIPAGKIIDENDIGIKRPGNGIRPERYDEILGKRARRDIPEDILLSEEDIF